MDQAESANLEKKRKEKWSMFFLIMNIPKVLDVVFSYSHSLTHPPPHAPTYIHNGGRWVVLKKYFMCHKKLLEASVPREK